MGHQPPSVATVLLYDWCPPGHNRVGAQSPEGANPFIEYVSWNKIVHVEQDGFSL